MSAYLKHFTTENDFKKCRTCSVQIKFKDLHTHGTSLRTHMLKQHPELFETDRKQSKLPKISDFYTENKHDLPALPKLDRVVITICSSKHDCRLTLSRTLSFNGDSILVVLTEEQFPKELPS